MAFNMNVFVLATLCVCAGAAIGSLEDEYPNVELPGLAVPNLDDSQDTDISSSDPPCCFPDQWQGNVTTQTGSTGGRGGRGGRGSSGKLTRSSSIVFVDQTNKRIAGKGPAGRYRNETGQFLVLFKDDKTADMYLFKLAQQKCFHKKLNGAEFKKQCIPANATLDGSFSLGPTSGGLQVQSWRFCGRSEGRRGSAAFVAGKIIVVPTGCVPVVIQDFGHIRSRRTQSGFETNEIDLDQSSFEEDDENDELDRKRPSRGGRSISFVASAYFSNVELSIKDPAVFDVPSFCNSTTTDDDTMLFNDEPMPDILERFITYQ